MYVLLIFLLFQLTDVLTYSHQKPLEIKLWSEKCKKNSVVLNDCNWCWCDARQRYQCKARVCNEIDMFGHFNDAIRDINVGMEGRGAWRSNGTSCSPGVHYQRGKVLCVCDEDGNWPNDVCKALFLILYSVKITGKTKITSFEPCTPKKLYLVGCNACFCPYTGLLDPNLCTKRDCDDLHYPVLDVKDGPQLIAEPNVTTSDLEVYAKCDAELQYKLGCMSCICIANNKLICDNCPNDTNRDLIINRPLTDQQPIARKNRNSYCNGKKPGELFNIGCNYCHCDKKLNLFCTAKKCIEPRNVKLKSQFKISERVKWRNAVAPPDDQNCISSTQYNRDCNTCKCVKLKGGTKVVDCTVRNCDKKSPIEIQKQDCVEGLYYQLDCKLCYCYVEDNVKHQVCQISENCVQNLVLNDRTKRPAIRSVDTQNGYCEPLFKYRNSCNMCRCLSDGKTYMCTSKVCAKRSIDNLPVDIVPAQMPYNEPCPAGHSYKLDCNVCYCLLNGNAICTTNDCANEDV
ncbi:uncharacterized protein LOC124540162 [Vanessa cardui]|uniref:uncharacterized protein LOC124540162 n=1 Tax=Vanessa cardui TaxID=171605 RepID=UPI001F13990D|nr:uncharacterized protein LOC124540162 [Vanessa cardui]